MGLLHRIIMIDEFVGPIIYCDELLGLLPDYDDKIGLRMPNIPFGPFH